MLHRRGARSSLNIREGKMRGYKLIHGIAHCQDCDWKEEKFTKASSEARKHHKQTGHTVDVELGFWKKYSDENN